MDPIAIPPRNNFEANYWLRALCYAAVAASTSVAGLFLGGILFETNIVRILIESTYVIMVGACSTCVGEFVATYINEQITRNGNPRLSILKTTSLSFGAYVGAAIPTTVAGLVTHNHIERIVVVLVVVFTLLSLFAVIISFAANISFWRCFCVIIWGAPVVVSCSFGISVFVKRYLSGWISD